MDARSQSVNQGVIGSSPKGEQDFQRVAAFLFEHSLIHNLSKRVLNWIFIRKYYCKLVLFRKYCREIVKELDKIPVYLPGTPVVPGDILRFCDSEALRRPIGSFVHYSNLSELGISFNLLNDNYPDPYLFSSKKSVVVIFIESANATTNITGKLDVSFSRQGATYLAAIDCSLSSIKDLMDVETQLKVAKPDLKCGNCNIVTYVIIANLNYKHGKFSL